MNKKIFLFFTFFISCQEIIFAQSLAKINTYLKDKKLDKAHYALNKISLKQQSNAAFEFLSAKYYLLFDKDSISYLDSANIHINKAIICYSKSSLKEKKSWFKIGIAGESLPFLKSTIDSQAFENTILSNSIKSYRHFLSIYKSSIFYKEAEEKLHELAFLEAYQSNNPDSLKNFMTAYPGSSQMGEAKIKYDILVFENQTKNGSLKDFEEFVKKNPESPFKEIAERKIFQFNTLHHIPAEYMNFLTKYPNNYFQKNAMQWLYLLFKDEHPGLDFFQMYPEFKLIPKWKNLIETNEKILYPVLEDGKYGFIDELGNTIIPSLLDSVPVNYFCDGIRENIIQIYNNSKLNLLDKEGKNISNDYFDSITHFETGLYKTIKNFKTGLISETGLQILPPIYDSVTVIAEKLIKASRSDLIQLFTINGKELLSAKGWEINNFADSLLVFEKEKTYSLIPVDNLLSNPYPKLKADFDSIKISDGFTLILFKNGEETLIFSPLLKTTLILDSTKINKVEEFLNKKFDLVQTHKNGFIVKGINGKYGYFNKKGSKILNTKYDELEIWDENAFKIKINGKTGLIDIKRNNILPAVFDGLIKIENGFIATLIKGKFGILHIKNNIKIFPEYESVPHLYDVKQKIFTVRKKGKTGLISEKNKKISEFIFDEIQYWQPYVALVRISETWQLYDIRSGEMIFRPFEKLKIIQDDDEQKLMKIFAGSKYGVLSNKYGLIIDFEYDELKNVGTIDKPFYVGQNYIKEAEVYLLYYLNEKGKIIRKQVLNQELYEKVSCD